MAAVTVTNRREQVWGNSRNIVCTVAIANTGDTWATGLKKVLQVCGAPTTNASYGATLSGGTVTFVTGGALTINIVATGY